MRALIFYAVCLLILSVFNALCKSTLPLCMKCATNLPRLPRGDEGAQFSQHLAFVDTVNREAE